MRGSVIRRCVMNECGLRRCVLRAYDRECDVRRCAITRCFMTRYSLPRFAITRYVSTELQGEGVCYESMWFTHVIVRKTLNDRECGVRVCITEKMCYYRIYLDSMCVYSRDGSKDVERVAK